MFCLREQICCDITWICSLIRQNKNLAWSGNRINTYMSIYRLLCKCDVNITWSDNLIYLWYTLCYIRKCCNCLCPTNLINCCCSCLFCSNQCCRIYLSVFSGRCHHNDFFNSGNFCRHNIHQNRRWINCLSTRNINSDTLKSRNFLSKYCSIRFAVKPTILHLFCMVRFNIF